MFHGAFWIVIIFMIALAFLSACAAQVQQTKLTANVTADGATRPVTLPSGNTVQQALSGAKISLSSTDRVDPPIYTPLTPGMSIVVTRVREVFETQQVVVPFERQELRNESLPSGEHVSSRLVKTGWTKLPSGMSSKTMSILAAQWSLKTCFNRQCRKLS